MELIEHAEGKYFLGDSGYDSEEIRTAVKRKKMIAVIHPHPRKKKPPRINRKMYKKRYIVECSFHTLKRFRAIATRYEKSLRNYKAIVDIGCMMMWIN